MHAKKLQNVLQKDDNFELNYELIMTLNVYSPVSRACQKFKCDKALSKYVKKKKYFVEPKEIQVGFDVDTGKAETIQYIPILETLKNIT